jgi:hypothetical protein
MRYKIALSSLFATLAFATPDALAQTAGQQGKFCLKSNEPATITCAYDTMAACEQSKKGISDQCAPNTGTIGAAPTAGPAPSTPANTTGMTPAGIQKNDPTAKPTEPSKNIQ